MKKLLGSIALLLCIITFSSCSLIISPDTVERIVLNFSSSAEEIIPLAEEYNGRKNYYYSALDEKGKKEYTKIYNGYMSNSPFSVDLSENEIENMFNCVLYDNPEIFWVGSAYSFSKTAIGVYIEPDYRFSEEEIKQKKLQLEMAVMKIVASAYDDDSEYGKEKFFHDYICKNTVYDLSTYGNLGDTAYSVFIDGKSICEGYSRAMKMLLDACGIYSYLVIGNTENDDGEPEGHMWNVVSIGGEFYHVDLTWDDLDGEPGDYNYLYFNMTDEDIGKDHYDITPYDNNCISDKYSYFSVNGLMFSDFNDPKSIAHLCAAGLNDNLFVEMRFSDKKAYEEIKTKAVNNETDEAFFNFTVEIAKASGQKIVSKSFVCIDDFNYLCIVFEKG